VPSTIQATIDVGNGYNERDLSAVFAGTRHSAREKKAELDLGHASILQLRLLKSYTFNKSTNNLIMNIQ